MPVPSRLRSRLGTRADASFFAQRILLPVANIIRVEEIAGGPLLVAATFALLWANTTWFGYYEDLWTAEVTLEFFGIAIEQSLRHWVDDLLLPLFFFVAGLEIKRELVFGELSTPRRAALPLAVAIGGMVVPALFYLGVNMKGGAPQGWGIPVATDIPFALAILAMLGKRAPRELKILVLAFAAVDDVGGVLIIAFVYSQEMSWTALGVATGLLALIVILKWIGVRQIGVYWLFGALLCLAMIESGVHATVAGVVLGLLAPARPVVDRREFMEAAHDLIHRLQEVRQQIDELEDDESTSEERKHRLHELIEEEDAILGRVEQLATGTESPVERVSRTVTPWVSYTVLPLYALANAGVALSMEGFSDPAAWRVSAGIAAGLVVGKPVGFLLFAWISLKIGLAHMPNALSWRHLIGGGILAGIGFTISLFIAELAFGYGDGPHAAAKIAILASSVLSAILGYLFLRFASVPGDRGAADRGL